MLHALFCDQSFAQPQTHSSEEQSEREGELQRARNEYWANIRTSGDEKDLSKIEKNAYNAIHSMVEDLSSNKSLVNPAWQPIAGSQLGHNNGRVRDITSDPSKPNTVYIATGTGGVWKTSDITAKPVQWVSLSDRLPTLFCGAIAFAPPNTLLLGTGEADGDGYRWPAGAGLFKSTDGGTNWNLVDSLGKTFSQIVVDSANPLVMYAAYNNSGYPPETGSILKSTNGGDTWRKLAVTISGPISIAYNFHQPLVLVAGGFGSMYRSEDSGATWKKVTAGLPSGSSKISVAVAPSNPNLFYASIGASSGSILGVWSSIDAGITWHSMMIYDNTKSLGGTNVNPLGQSQYWCNTIAVRPSDPKQIYVAGLDLYSSSDSGKSKWVQVSYQYATPGNSPNEYIHADHHRIVFLGNVFYDCGDGGLARSVSPYTTWNTSVNAGIATLEFVGVDADKDFTFVSGGCQDNQTNRALIGDAEFTPTRGGDGGRGWVSSENSSIVYTTYIRTTFYPSSDGGKNFDWKNPIERNTDLYRIDEFQSGSGEGSPFYPSYDASPDGTIIAFGGNSHIWMSYDGGADGFMAVPKSKSTQLGVVNAVHVFQGDSQSEFMWAGASNVVWRSVDMGQTWTAKNIGELVQGITSNPLDNNEVFVVTQGIGVSKKHFFKSTDGGATFVSPAVNFPNIGCWAVAYNPNDGNLYVGTDKGVIYSYDGGIHWNPLMNGMPMVEVLSLKLRGPASDKLLAGTYGRGVFWIDVSQFTGVSKEKEFSDHLKIDPVALNQGTEPVIIQYELKDPGVTTLSLHDMLGREIKILEKSYLASGTHQARFTKSNLSAGAYFLRLTENGRSISQKFIITR
ncbi:MAG: T9SS type A sorting domain-containing protein [Ignavibacteriota bacterium]